MLSFPCLKNGSLVHPWNTSTPSRKSRHQSGEDRVALMIWSMDMEASEPVPCAEATTTGWMMRHTQAKSAWTVIVKSRPKLPMQKHTVTRSSTICVTTMQVAMLR